MVCSSGLWCQPIATGVKNMSPMPNLLARPPSGEMFRLWLTTGRKACTA